MPPILKDRRVLVAVALVAAAAGWWWWRPAALEVVTIEANPIRETLQLTGRVVTRDRVLLSSQVSATVARVAVEAGDRVKAGQVLVTLDNPEIAAAARQATAALAQAEARLARLKDIEAPTASADAERAQIEFAQAERQVKLLEPLLAQQTVSAEQYRAAQETAQLRQHQYETARLRASGLAAGGRDRKLAEADVVQAAATRDVAAARLGWTTLRAPANGLVVARHVDPGALVQPGATLIEFAPTAAIEVRIDVDERFLDLLKPSQVVKIIADAYPDERIDGSVRLIAPRVDAARGTVEVRVAVPNPPPWLREDMTTSVELLVGDKPAVPVVPVAAVMDQNSKPWAWCVTDGTLQRCDLKLGLRDEKNAEVLAGAGAGTVIVANANKALKPGVRVRTRQAAD